MTRSRINGTNRLLGRRVLLTDGVEADATSGNILKRYHAALTAEYLQNAGDTLCSACARRDGRRAAGLPVAEQRMEESPEPGANGQDHLEAV